MTYTKGPWRVKENEHGIPIVTAETDDICQIDDVNRNWRGNLQLICVAPSLVKMLKRVIQVLTPIAVLLPDESLLRECRHLISRIEDEP